MQMTWITLCLPRGAVGEGRNRLYIATQPTHSNPLPASRPRRTEVVSCLPLGMPFARFASMLLTNGETGSNVTSARMFIHINIFRIMFLNHQPRCTLFYIFLPTRKQLLCLKKLLDRMKEIDMAINT